jgi:hypothetical protein
MRKSHKFRNFCEKLEATDMLEACDAGVLTALALAEQNNGKLYILHVLEFSSTNYRQYVKHVKTGVFYEYYREEEESCVPKRS